MAGFNIAEMGHVITLLAPIADGSAASSEILSMENWKHCTVIINSGAGGSGYTIIPKECKSFTGLSAQTFLGWTYIQETTAAGDTATAALAAGPTTGVFTGTGSGVYTIFEIDSSNLSDGYSYLYVTNDGAGTGVASIIACLSGARYAEAITKTAIA